ncbi:MAG: NhaA family Na+:H+ antiporter [Acidimicrobiales bacterium]
MSHPPIPEFSFLGSRTFLARFFARPVRRFLRIQASGGMLMLAATVAALVWANSRWSHGYESFWHTPIDISVGSFHLGGGHHLDLRAIVNDGLMAIFFFVVGLEIKRELVTGQLRTVKAAALPAIAALGGMVVPAAIYLAFTSGTDASNGWGIPMATDIAFAVGLVSLLGSRVDRKLLVFLLSLAIVDDLGAIAVIALFYAETISMGWLATACAILALTIMVRVVRVWYIPVYALLGVALWVATLQSGLHATIAGVLLGVITPARPIQTQAQVRKWVDWLRDKDDEIMAVDVNYAAFHIREAHSVAERVITALHPLSSFVIVPLFAMANAGIPLSGSVLADSASASVTWGVAMGLVVGKAVGITAFTWVGIRLGLAALPSGMNMRHVGALAAISGVGFTVALFVTGLAFTNEVFQTQAKIGILGGSAVAGVGGLALMAMATRPSGSAEEDSGDRPAIAHEPTAAERAGNGVETPGRRRDASVAVGGKS